MPTEPLTPQSFSLAPMTVAAAHDIAAWRYAPPYDFYNTGGPTAEIMAELLGGAYYAVLDASGELAGFFAFGPDCTVPGGEHLYRAGALDIGLGMRPDRTGRGEGLAFVRSGVDFAREQLHAQIGRLSVARFNARAIRVYERAGFREVGRFISRQARGDTEFIVMQTDLLSDPDPSE